MLACLHMPYACPLCLQNAILLRSAPSGDGGDCRQRDVIPSRCMQHKGRAPDKHLPGRRAIRETPSSGAATPPDCCPPRRAPSLAACAARPAATQASPPAMPDAAHQRRKRVRLAAQQQGRQHSLPGGTAEELQLPCGRAPSETCPPMLREAWLGTSRRGRGYRGRTADRYLDWGRRCRRCCHHLTHACQLAGRLGCLGLPQAAEVPPVSAAGTHASSLQA